MTETKDQRKGWLKDLKVGDQVFVVELRGVFSSYKTLATVEKITPTGRINVEDINFRQQEVFLKIVVGRDWNKRQTKLLKVSMKISKKPNIFEQSTKVLTIS